MAYLHGDGVYQKYGTEKATATKAGEYKMFGEDRMIEIRSLDLTTLTTTAAIVSDVVRWPATYVVSEVEVWTKTAATTGTSAALDVGLIQSNRSTEIDFDGILDAVAVTDMNADGEKVRKLGPPASGGLGVLADKDSVTATAGGYITASTSTGTFTAGVVDVRIYLRPLV